MIRAALVLAAGTSALFGQPLLTSLAPTTVTAGAPGFSLVLTGSFPVGSEARWNGARIPTRVESGARLVAEVTGPLLALPGQVKITVSGGGKESASLDLTVLPRIEFVTAPRLPPAILGEPYSAAVAATGGTPPLVYSVSIGRLPEGLLLDAATGGITGRAIVTGDSRFTITVTDGSRAAAARAFDIAVSTPLTITTDSLPAVTVGRAFKISFEAKGGRPPYSWDIAGGTLPEGFTFHPGGTLSGTPVRASLTPLNIRVRDAAGLTAQAALSVTVQAALAIVEASALTGSVGEPFAAAFGAVGGAAPYSWRLSQGALPPGLSLDARTGRISGRATQPGSFTFTLEVADAYGLTASRAVTLAFTAPLRVTVASVHNAELGSSFSLPLTAEGGTPPYSWRALDTLPPGLAVSDGRLSGTPAAAETYAFRIEAIDAQARRSAAALSLRVVAPELPAISLGLAPSVAPGEQVRLAFTLARPYPVDLVGALTVRSSAPDPAVQFNRGGQAIAWQIPAGQVGAGIAAQPLWLQVGTLAARLTLTVTPNQGTPQQFFIDVAASAPVMRQAALTQVAGGLEVWITGFTPTRELVEAEFRFAPAAGRQLDTTRVVIPLARLGAEWYNSAEAPNFGGLFRYRQAFTIDGDLAAIGQVTVVLRNSVGASEEVTAGR